jgi:hypothetical protein
MSRTYVMNVQPAVSEPRSESDRLDASSTQADQQEARRVVGMIERMITAWCR